MDKILLDNMTGQEIKELIADEIITLQELDVPALEKVLDFEIEMICHGNGDMDVMRQCSEILDERSKSDKLNHDDILAIINKTKSEQVTIINADNACPSVVAPQRKMRFVFKRIAIVAAAIIIMMTTTVAIAAAFGVNILGYLNQVIRQDKGSEIIAGDFTFHHQGEIKEYSSLEEMIEMEKLDILYPTELPDGIYIDKVMVLESPIAEKEICITTTDPNIIITVFIEYYENIPAFEDAEIFQVNNCRFYIENNIAMCFNKGNYYSIKADDFDDLIMIIENFKE